MHTLHRPALFRWPAGGLWGVLLLAGCASMLPVAHNSAPSTFQDFAQAQQALEHIAPFHTRMEDLAAMGFDPHAGTNVTQIPYPEIAARLAPHPGVPLQELDPGVHRCINAQTACRGYVFRFGRQDRQREGNFWLDFLNIKRTTHITGWQFEALIVVADGVVLFRNFAGEAHTDRTERTHNPLGPLQSAGEAAGRLIVQ